jgi:LysR family nitrogen assimilation transcriptional regulator
MNLKQLEYFVHVAELGSFSKAALVLDIAQPALSRQVRALETDLRETLLLRNGRGVTLTEAGQRLFEHGVGILQFVAQAREDMGAERNEPVGHITIAVPPTISRQLTLPLIDAFKRRLPRGRLAIVEGFSTHIVEWLTTGRADVGLLYNPQPQPALEISPVMEEPLCLVTPLGAGPGARAPRVAGSAMPLRALPDYPLVMPERSHVIRRVLEAQATLAGLKLDIACAGYGHAVLTESAVRASGRADELLVRPLVQPALTSVLCLATSVHRRPSPLSRQATKLLVELVKALPQGEAARSQPG